MALKVIRTICYFTRNPSPKLARRIKKLYNRATDAGYLIQTQRLCCPSFPIAQLADLAESKELILSVGTLDRTSANRQLDDFLGLRDVGFNLDLSEGAKMEDVDLFFKVAQKQPSKTFHFAYTFQNVSGSPFFPSANFEREGFAIGLQPTNLSEGCDSLAEWFSAMSKVWAELVELFGEEKDFLGIDSSVAPLFAESGSFVNFIRKVYPDFSTAVTSDCFLQISNYIKTKNPQPVGLCGLMFPCLEDFELAEEYEKGNFSVERNLFLSLHSGLGIDTYPIGIDESPEKILGILRLVGGLAKKHRKPLAVRFVSDGKSKIGQRSNFENQYLKEVIIRPL